MAPGDKRSRSVWRPAGLALAAVLAMGEAAWAQHPALTVFGRILTAAPEDLPIVRKASAPLFEAAAAGMSKDWSNPQNGNSGSITLRRVFALKGMPCRTFDYVTWTEHHTNQVRVVVDWCKVADDGWKLVNPREPGPESPQK